MDISAQRDSRYDESTRPSSSDDYSDKLKKIELLRQKLRDSHNVNIVRESDWIKRDFIDVRVLHNNPELSKLGIFPTTVYNSHRHKLIRALMFNFNEFVGDIEDEYANDNEKDNRILRFVKWFLKKLWKGVKLLWKLVKKLANLVKKFFKNLVRWLKNFFKKAVELAKKGFALAKKGIKKAVNYLKKTKFAKNISKWGKSLKKKVRAKLTKATKAIKKTIGKSIAKQAKKITQKSLTKNLKTAVKETIKKAKQPGMAKRAFKAVMKSKWFKPITKATRAIPLVGAAATGGIEFYDLWGKLESIQALKENNIIDEQKEADLKKFAYATSGAAVAAEVATNVTATVGLGLTTGVGALAGGAAGIAAGETARYTTGRVLAKSQAEYQEWKDLLDQGQELLDNGYELKESVEVDEGMQKFYEEQSKFQQERAEFYKKLVESNTISQSRADEFLKEDIEGWNRANPDVEHRSNYVPKLRDYGMIDKTPVPGYQSPIQSIVGNYTSSEIKSSPNTTPIPQTNLSTNYVPQTMYTPIPDSSPTTSQVENKGITQFKPIKIPQTTTTPHVKNTQSGGSILPSEVNDNTLNIINSGYKS